jgi:hypothetical protein
MIQRLPVLLCPHCQEQTALPYRPLRGTSEVQSYWPTDSQLLTLACHHCSHSSVHWERDVRRMGVQAEDPSQQPGIFWKVEFSCAHALCGLSIVVYTRTEDGVTAGTAQGRAYNVTPKPECAAGHRGRANPKSIVRVEWTGEDGYLT